MKQVNILFVTWWMAVSCSFSFTWSSSINGIFSAKDILDLTVGSDPNLLDAIANGAQLAMDECQSAFYWDRWNCPLTDFSRKQKQHVTREQAVIQSILSAGITHAIAKNCSDGLIPGCGCVAKQDVPTIKPYTKLNEYGEQNQTTKVDFALKGCQVEIDYGETVSKNILDRQVTGNDIQAKINLHNNNVGRKLIKESMIKKCRCHGVSGSCTMQTCWMEFAPFSTIAKLIRNKYHRAERIELGNDNRLLSQNVENEIKNKSKSVLLFLGPSVNHCLPNSKTGWPGTKGRSCSRDKLETTTPEERKSCRHLCRTCGYKNCYEEAFGNVAFKTVYFDRTEIKLLLILVRGQYRKFGTYTLEKSQLLNNTSLQLYARKSQPTTAFGIATVVLSVQNAELNIELTSHQITTTTTENPTTKLTTLEATTETTTQITTETTTDITTETTTDITTETTTDITTVKPTGTTTLTTTDTTTEETSSPTQPPLDNMTYYRLPTHVVPISYDLTIQPNLVDGLFTGKVYVTVDVTEETKSITLHSNKLTITTVTVDDEPANSELIPKYELLVIDLQNGNKIKPGSHNIDIEYSGDMKDGIVGLYKSTYINEKGEKRNIATSKFEPTYARQAFPCFDEPGFKATYAVHILKPSDDITYIALSNMPEMDVTTRDDGELVHFGKSVPMSTYLTCFIVCDFQFKEKKVVTQNGTIDLKVYATPAQLNKTDFALGIADGVLKYFVEYFNYEYPLPKLDLIAIPDFVSGAMEHWGLVTFRETALLYDEKISSTINKQRVATVVSHELAHSWFGNLVTMSWWNDLWLNEGFASYIQYKGVDFVHKDWQMMDQFLIDTLHPVLSIDALSSSHPIIKTVVTPDEITEIFDSITYSKGASILRMLEQAVGEDVFKSAVQNYLMEHAFDNAITQDLLDQIQPLLKDELNVTEFLDTWTRQVGYPILTVTNVGAKDITLEQKRFLKNSEKEKSGASSDEYSWAIPVTLITDESDTPELHWFNHTMKSLVIPIPKNSEWIKFNHNQVGYYRINYLPSQWRELSNNIKTLNVADRTHLLEESFSIAESGELSYKIPLDMTKYLDTETEYIPWSVASTKLIELNKYLSSTSYFKYLDYIMKIAEPIYQKVTWEEKSKQEDHLTKRTRITILGLLSYIEHEDCLKEASERLDEWFKNNKTTKVTQDLRSVVYKYGMVYANREKWTKMLNRFEEEGDANEKINMMRGLAAVKNPELLKHLIELGKTEDVIRGQDYFSMLQYISSNSVGTSIVWDYVRENWEHLVERFTLNDRNLGKLIPAITSSFTTTMRLKEMEDFFEKYPDAGAGTAARAQALETVKANINWVSKNKKDVEDWIKINVPK